VNEYWCGPREHIVGVDVVDGEVVGGGDALGAGADADDADRLSVVGK
jgi:hypothetical protein